MVVMPNQTVLLLGATGETGGDILNGLLEDGNFDVTCLIRPQSVEKSSVQAIKNRNIKTAVIDLSSSVEELAQKVKRYDVIISAIDAAHQLDQLKLVDAASLAGTKRFVPCGFTTICPPNSGIMKLRDDKEVIHQRIWYHHLPYTIIDVGFWHQVSWPRLPSGKADYALLLQRNTIYGDGNAPNLFTDKRDMGRFVARIIQDERTLNQKVFTYSDVLSQRQIIQLLEEKSGEKIETDSVSAEDCIKSVEQAKKAAEADPSKGYEIYIAQYNMSTYIRGDNTPEVAKYLGYLDARQLYPHFKPISFSEFLDELLGGKAVRPYPDGFR